MATLPVNPAEATEETPKGRKKPMDIRTRWRSRTNYDSPRMEGYAPLHFAAVIDIGRLTAGKATQIMYVLWAATLGEQKKGAGYFETSTPITTREIAELSSCDERTVQRELADLKRRKVINWEQPKKGVNVVTVLFRSWVSLPDYQAGPVAEPKPEEIPDETPEQEEARRAGNTVLTRKPVFGRAGKPTKPIRVDCGVESLQFQSDLDAKWSAVVQGGVLLVSLEKWQSGKGVKGLVGNKGDTRKDATRMSDLGPDLQGRSKGELHRGQSTPKGRGSQSRPSPVVQHPRSEELTALFDPFLLKSCRKTLSGDHQSLLKACEAIKDVDHNFLVRAVVDRGARPIASPHACVAICKEIAHNYTKLTGRHKAVQSEGCTCGHRSTCAWCRSVA